MKIVKKYRLRAALVAATALGATLVAPTPAHAQIQQCSINSPFISCTTGVLYPHADHWMKMRVYRPYVGTLTCYLKDAVNGITVGQATVSSSRPRGFHELITVNGLYGRYFAQCINTSQWGTGRIINDNADL